VDGEVVGPGLDVVGHVHLVPDEAAHGGQLLRDAVRDVHEAALARGEPEGDAVLAQPEALRPGEGDVELLLRPRGEEREVREDVARALLGEVTLELREVAVARHVTDLDRPVAAAPEHGAEADPPMGGAEDGERIRPRLDRVVVEPIAHEDRRARGSGGRGQDRGEG
jgi:hypothetical protein